MKQDKGSSVIDVKQIWTIFDPPAPSPIVTRFITKAFVLSSQKTLTPSLPRPWRHLWTTPKCYTVSTIKNIRYEIVFNDK